LEIGKLLNVLFQISIFHTITIFRFPLIYFCYLYDLRTVAQASACSETN